MAKPPAPPYPSAEELAGGSPRSAGAEASKAKSKRGGITRRFSQTELIKFSRSMASMLKAQINTSQALAFYAMGHPNPDVRKVLENIRAALDAGAPVHVAFGKTERFDDKFVSLIRAGADSGRIDRAFTSIAHRLKKEAAFRAKLKKAIVVPTLIIFSLVGIFIGAQIRVVPEVEGLLIDFRQEPDPFSGFLFKVSHVVQKIWPLILITMFGGLAAVILLQGFRNQLLFLLMARWRLLRKLIMGMRQMLYLGTLNMLHSNGVSLAKSTEIAAGSLRGTPMYQELLEAGRKYQNTGLPYSEAIRKYTSCDPQVTHMISIGERSSSLGQQLDLLAEMYEEDVDVAMEEFTQVVNFIALVVAALLIAVVFIGSYLPIFLMGPKMMNASGM